MIKYNTKLFYFHGFNVILKINFIIIIYKLLRKCASHTDIWKLAICIY